ncbi:MAG: flagellar basal body protein, partial [Pirellulaceae bacterium]
MFSGIYSNASAMDVESRRHEVIANNLANANSAGFRRTILAVSTRGSNAA